MNKNQLYFDPSIIDSLAWLEYFARRSLKINAAMKELVRTFTINDVMWDFDLKLKDKYGLALETIQINRRNLTKRGILREYVQTAHRGLQHKRHLRRMEIEKKGFRVKIRRALMNLSWQELKKVNNFMENLKDAS